MVFSPPMHVYIQFWNFGDPLMPILAFLLAGAVRRTEGSRPRSLRRLGHDFSAAAGVARRRGITEAVRREAPRTGMTYVLDAASQKRSTRGHAQQQ